MRFFDPQFQQLRHLKPQLQMLLTLIVAPVELDCKSLLVIIFKGIQCMPCVHDQLALVRSLHTCFAKMGPILLCYYAVAMSIAASICCLSFSVHSHCSARSAQYRGLVCCVCSLDYLMSNSVKTQRGCFQIIC